MNIININNNKKIEKNDDKNNDNKKNKENNILNNNNNNNNINAINNKSFIMNNNNNNKQPNITNINIINYNTINENFIQDNCQNVFINKNPNDKAKNNNMNSIMFKKNDITQKENNENKNNNIIDNAYKTFYQKNKDKDIYNIKLNLDDCGSCDANNIMNNNFNYDNNCEIINEAEEFNHDEKIKIAQISNFYKNNEKSPGKIKYLQKISPSKNYYFSKNMNHSKNNFQLPVILKGNVYNNNFGIFTHKKYNNFY